LVGCSVGDSLVGGSVGVAGSVGGGSVGVGSSVAGTSVGVGGSVGTGVSVGRTVEVGAAVDVSVGCGVEVGGCDVAVAADRAGTSEDLAVIEADVTVGVWVGNTTNVENTAGDVWVGWRVAVGPVTGTRICVGPNSNASTVMAAAVRITSTSASCVSSIWTSAAVGGLGSKKAIVYTIHPSPIHTNNASSACKGTINSRVLMWSRILSKNVVYP
jgi:hypothetical protein